jgi:hypothetical protein
MYTFHVHLFIRALTRIVVDISVVKDTASEINAYNDSFSINFVLASSKILAWKRSSLARQRIEASQ